MRCFYTAALLTLLLPLRCCDAGSMPNNAAGASSEGAHLIYWHKSTCFTGTKEPILTPEDLLESLQRLLELLLGRLLELLLELLLSTVRLFRRLRHQLRCVRRSGRMSIRRASWRLTLTSQSHSLCLQTPHSHCLCLQVRQPLIEP